MSWIVLDGQCPGYQRGFSAEGWFCWLTPGGAERCSRTATRLRNICPLVGGADGDYLQEATGDFITWKITSIIEREAWVCLSVCLCLYVCNISLSVCLSVRTGVCNNICLSVCTCMYGCMYVQVCTPWWQWHQAFVPAMFTWHHRCITPLSIHLGNVGYCDIYVTLDY